MTQTRIPVPRRGRPRKRAIDSPETESPERSAVVKPVRQGQTPQGIVGTSDYQILTVPTSKVPTSTVPPMVASSAYPASPPSALSVAYLALPLAMFATAYSVPQIPMPVTTYSSPVPAVLVVSYPVLPTVPLVAPTYVYSIVPPAIPTPVYAATSGIPLPTYPAVPPIGSAPVVLPSSISIPTDMVVARARIPALAESVKSQFTLFHGGD
ncbi:calphotin-like [Zingiber officinale]|uniref:calphotin-like n=1 Tax=Zingiber officinale TaxID=94328 RepID=UPI001C4D1437|nr:calphotin-like [Zingiber officinale]